MSDTDTAAANPKSRRWLWVALIVSLALNLLFIGVTVGAFLMGGPWGPPRHRVMAAAMNEVVRSMPDERRKAARKLLDRIRPEIRSLRRQVRKARRATVMAFRSDPFDEAAFKQAAGELEKAEMNLRVAKTAIAVQLGEHLTAEERRQFLRTVMKKSRAGRWKRRHDRELPPPRGAEQDMPDADDGDDTMHDQNEPDQETSAPANP